MPRDRTVIGAFLLHEWSPILIGQAQLLVDREAGIVELEVAVFVEH